MGIELNAEWQGWGFYGTLLALVSIFLTIWLFWLPRYETHIREQLDDAHDRADIRDTLLNTKDAFERYQQGIVWLNTRFQHWFGDAWSWRAFDRYLLLAFIYPICLLMLAWLFGAPGKIGHLTIFPDQPPWRRLLSVSLLITLGVGMFFWLRKKIPQQFGRWLRAWVEGKLPPTFQRIVMWTADLAQFVAATFAVAIVVIFAGAIAGTGAGAIAVAGTVAGAVAGTGAVAVAVAFAITFVGAGAVAVQYLIFLVALPIANALLDWVSWGATRMFLRRFSAHRRGMRGVLLAIAAIVMDLAVALACLVVLAGLTALILEAMNALFQWINLPIFDWRSQVGLAIEAPFTKGWLVTGTLLTTLIPTAIHLAVGWWHIASAWTPESRAAASLISDNMRASEKQKVIGVMRRRQLWYVPTSFASLVFVGGIIWLYGTTVRPIGKTLSDVAYCSASLVRGHCTWNDPIPVAPPRLREARAI